MKKLIIGLLLIAYSIIGGLSLPLAPNIEKAEILRNDSILTIDVYAPKIKEDVEIYLIKTAIKKEDTRKLKATKIERKKDGFIVTFDHPKYDETSKKNQSYDLWAQNSFYGYMVYFDVLTLDTVIGNKRLNYESTDDLIKKKPFQLALPNRPILRESIRNLFYHVPMWFSMIAMLTMSLYYSIKYLNSGEAKFDEESSSAIEIGIVFGILGILTGMIWARYTWGAFWTDDPKLNGAAIGLLVYFAYTILRKSYKDKIQRGKISSVYNIFAYSIYIVFIFILPRLKSSLHPGNGGNPGFNIYEQDDTMRLIFYPAVIGWILIGIWLKNLKIKLNK